MVAENRNIKHTKLKREKREAFMIKEVFKKVRRQKGKGRI
jgi:hypothetical protein